MKHVPGESRRTAIRAAVLAICAALLPGPASAFDSKGHVVVEALAYRTLIEGYDGQPPRPDVLNDLFNDGDLAPPLCFGWGDHPPGFCGDAPRARSLPHEILSVQLSIRLN